MANKPKKRIDYAGWSVDIFSNDVKIDKLLDAQGWVGFGVYFYLCNMAFGSEGYYYEWSYDLSASTAKKMGGGVGSGTVKETVAYCLQIGLFNKGLFDRWGVLTSRGIQNSYLVVLKSNNRKGTKIFEEYWLLEKNDEDYQGVVFVHKNELPFTVNSNSLGVNSNSLQQENSRGNNSRNINTMCKADALALFEELWNLYPSKKGKAKVSEKAKLQLLKVGHDEMVRAIDRYKTELSKDSWRHPQNGSTFFNSGYVDYLDANYVPGQQLRARNDFLNHEQSSTDYAALEKMLE